MVIGVSSSSHGELASSAAHGFSGELLRRLGAGFSLGDHFAYFAQELLSTKQLLEKPCVLR
jgi:hypothetical protein